MVLAKVFWLVTLNKLFLFIWNSNLLFSVSDFWILFELSF